MAIQIMKKMKEMNKLILALAIVLCVFGLFSFGAIAHDWFYDDEGFINKQLNVFLPQNVKNYLLDYDVILEINDNDFGSVITLDQGYSDEYVRNVIGILNTAEFIVMDNHYRTKVGELPFNFPHCFWDEILEKPIGLHLRNKQVVFVEDDPLCM